MSGDAEVFKVERIKGQAVEVSIVLRHTIVITYRLVGREVLAVSKVNLEKRGHVPGGLHVPCKDYKRMREMACGVLYGNQNKPQELGQQMDLFA